jgi:hypothetical protein
MKDSRIRQHGDFTGWCNSYTQKKKRMIQETILTIRPDNGDKACLLRGTK